jgi:hypothetical protein
LEDGEDAEFHAEEAEEVDERLLEPPSDARGAAVVAAADGLWRVGYWSEQEGAMEKFEEEN